MRRTALSIGLVLLVGCKSSAEQAPPPVAPVAKAPEAKKPPPPPPGPTAADAKAFADRVNADLKQLLSDWERAEWIKSTYITHDTEVMAAGFHEKVLAYTSQAIKEATKFDGLALDPDTARTIALLKVSESMPAPNDAAKRKRLAEISAQLESIYGKGKYCDSKGACKDLGELSKVMAESHDYSKLLDAWKGWRTISPEMRPMYSEFVSIANEGAKEIGFENLGELWRASYDMTPAEFEAETDRLWGQVKPLYDQLHCYVRGKLAARYGKDKVDPKGLIPAHLLGNMWAQEWANIYPLVEPYKGAADIDVTKALNKKGFTPVKMVKMAEGFFTSLGMDPLPDTFWERSMFTQPKDREVVCHASAWDVSYDNDLRIKMCIKVDEEDLITIHHELGHDYYYMYYHTLPVLYQQGAHDGFHEGIGDTLALSVTPGYLQKAGILGPVKKNEKALINLQMKEALDKIAFLPFGKLIDQWRWDVFSGKVPADKYNEAWWALREKYQGIKAPVARTEADFDPGAKYHIPSNVPYTRYFLARILQFQFHKALCEVAGHTGPLHECSIYGSKAAGDKMKAMLAMGASKPWPEALKAVTGTEQMDASALVEYFQPLMGWLEEQNKGQQCGW
ncbi:MAG: M2 family metallopeptidase [Myxococcales bacterium]|nr:M2 family metallopeptidase [Myxococcales bacterium]